MLQNLLLHPKGGEARLEKNELGSNKESNIWMQGILRPFLMNLPEPGSKEELLCHIGVTINGSRILDAVSGFGIYSFDSNFLIEDC